MKHSLLRTPLLVLAILAVVATLVYAQSSTRGTWNAEVRSDEPGTINLQMQRAMKHSNMGSNFKIVEMDQMVAMRMQSATPEFAQELAKLGHSNLSAQKLINFRIHGVNSSFIEKAKRAGYKHALPDELINFKILGIRQKDDDTI